MISKMVSLEKCREIYAKHGYSYTDEQLLEIRDFLYKMAAFQFKACSTKEDNEVTGLASVSYKIEDAIKR